MKSVWNVTYLDDNGALVSGHVYMSSSETHFIIRVGYNQKWDWELKKICHSS